ncbi:MAG: WXG100 family type VII secretion target [Oscillospiraceae bacterium]|nr:WXG100 family type VII secretion target [Oscillospiraceae bacterium]MCR4758928.1 WXG100 family type VII secretion target [Oscillospiraceae bacterium]
MARITVNTDQVKEIAAALSALNTKLRDTLNESQATITGLSRVWTGEAFEATKAAFDSFAQRYFQQYQEVIESYVRFLNNQVSEGYFQVETANTQAAEAFK